MSAIKLAVEGFSKTVVGGARVLDVGCGLRPYEVFFSHAKYIGIDVAQSGRLAEGKKIDFEFDGVNIPFEDNSYDIVICTEVLEHAIQPESLLKEISRVLDSGGRLFLTVPFIWGLHELPFDFRRYTTVGIKSEIEKAGLEITKIDKLVTGLEAMRMLIASETSYYINYRIAPELRSSYRFRMSLWVQQKLLRALFYIWQGQINFERIYIDNLVIAQKPKLDKTL